MAKHTTKSELTLYGLKTIVPYDLLMSHCLIIAKLMSKFMDRSIP